KCNLRLFTIPDNAAAISGITTSGLLRPVSLLRRARLRGRRTRLRHRPLQRLPVMERPAAERREAGAKDHAGVHMIGARDDAFLERLFALVDERVDQSAAKLGEFLIAEACRALLGLAVDPLVEAFACLLAELLFFHEAHQRVIFGR